MSDTPTAEPKGLAYSRITEDEQKQLLEQRLRNLEAEHFQHNTNLQAGIAAGNDDVVATSKASMVAIEQVHAEIEKQLKAL
jgi:hypothetical protein